MTVFNIQFLFYDFWCLMQSFQYNLLASKVFFFFSCTFWPFYFLKSKASELCRMWFCQFYWIRIHCSIAVQMSCLPWSLISHPPWMTLPPNWPEIQKKTVLFLFEVSGKSCGTFSDLCQKFTVSLKWSLACGVQPTLYSSVTEQNWTELNWA